MKLLVFATTSTHQQGGSQIETSNEKESSVPKVLYSIGGVIAVTGILVCLVIIGTLSVSLGGGLPQLVRSCSFCGCFYGLQKA